MYQQRNNIRRGYFGETAACKYLTSLGYKIIERNFKKRYGEIDIVACQGKTLVFVEVKTRRGTSFGTPEEAITPWKMSSLIKSAQYYKLIHPNSPDAMRIDLISIHLNDAYEIEKIQHYKNISQ